MNAADAKNVFDLGARTGSLEGYLYVGKDVEASYLPGWLDNIERDYEALPLDLRNACRDGFYEVMRKVAAYLKRLYGDQDENACRAAEIVAKVRSESAG